MRVAKTVKTWQGMDLPRGHHLKSGPAQLEGTPFQLHHIGVDLTDFWGCFK